jgi:uncharacterized protein (DUF1330 family)
VRRADNFSVVPPIYQGQILNTIVRSHPPHPPTSPTSPSSAYWAMLRATASRMIAAGVARNSTFAPRTTIPAVMAIVRRSIGAGYTGEREAGFDQAELDKLRAMGDAPFFMLNILKIVDLDAWTEYYTNVDAIFKEVGAENVYSGLIRDAPIPVKALGIDTSDYSLVVLNKFPSANKFFEFADSDVYQENYHLRLKALARGKSSLLVTFPLAGSAVDHPPRGHN